MIEIMKASSTEFVPETKDEAFGEMMGRYNALRNWLLQKARTSYFDSDMSAVATILGYTDVLRVAEEKKKEKAGVGSTD